LKNSPEEWPDLPTRYKSDVANDEQVKNSLIVVHALTALTYDLESLNLDEIMDARRYRLKHKE